MSNVSLPLLPPPILNTETRGVLLQWVRSCVSSAQSPPWASVLQEKSKPLWPQRPELSKHPPSPFISLTSPIRYSPQCYTGSGLPRIPQKLPSVLLSCCSLCLEYSSHRYLHGSLPQPPSGVYLNECFIHALFWEFKGRIFLNPSDHLSLHVPFLCSRGVSQVYLLLQIQLLAKLVVVLLLWSLLFVFWFSFDHTLVVSTSSRLVDGTSSFKIFILRNVDGIFMKWFPEHLLTTYFLPCVACSPQPTEENLELREVAALPRAT